MTVITLVSIITFYMQLHFYDCGHQKSETIYAQGIQVGSLQLFFYLPQ